MDTLTPCVQNYLVEEGRLPVVLEAYGLFYQDSNTMLQLATGPAKNNNNVMLAEQQQLPTFIRKSDLQPRKKRACCLLTLYNLATAAVAVSFDFAAKI